MEYTRKLHVSSLLSTDIPNSSQGFSVILIPKIDSVASFRDEERAEIYSASMYLLLLPKDPAAQFATFE